LLYFQGKRLYKNKELPFVQPEKPQFIEVAQLFISAQNTKRKICGTIFIISCKK